MRKAVLISLLLLALPAPVLAAPAPADPPPILVELYTAQGCASCGEANAYLARLSEQPGVLALTFPVDYWDYLGWPDTFAKPEFTERQKAYVARLALREPYTPQVVVDGRAEAAGLKTDRVDQLVQAARSAPHNPPEILFIGPRRVDVGSGRAPKNAEVWMIRYDPRAQEIAVRSGDNRGQTISQKNVVRDVKRLGAWRGRPTAFRLPPAEEEGLRTVVVVQAGDGGRVLAVAQKRPAPPKT